MADSDAETERPAASRAMRSIERAFLIGVPEATEVILVRHADCYAGLDDTLNDPPLSAAGREQARRLGERLRRLELNEVYSSPLLRAQQTASAISDRIRLDERLVEVAADLSQGVVQVTETPEESINRMSTAITEAVQTHPGGRVVMVTHGVAIVNYLCDVLRVEPGRLRLLPYYTSVSVVRVLGDRRMAGALADVGHLEGLPWLT